MKRPIDEIGSIELITIQCAGQTISHAAHTAYWLERTEIETPPAMLQRNEIDAKFREMAIILGYKISRRRR